MLEQEGMNFWWKLQNLRKDHMALILAGGNHSQMALSLTGSICTPPFPTIILRYSTSSAENMHFSSLRYIFCSQNYCRTFRVHLLCISWFEEWISRSSI